MMSTLNKRKVLVIDFNIVYPVLSGYSLLNQIKTDKSSDYVFIFNFKSQLYEILCSLGYKCYVVEHGRSSGWKKIIEYSLVLFKTLIIAKYEKPTLVHANNALAGRLAVLIAKILCIPSLVQIRNTGFPPRTNFILKHATRILAVSNFVKNSLPSSLHFKVDVVYDGQTFQNFPNKDSLNHKKISIGMSSRISKQKGINLFLKLEKNLNRLGYSEFVEFYHCGGSPDAPVINDELLLESKVKWLGYIDNVNEFWKSIDIGVLTSNDDEAFGRVIIEAVSNGVTFIASKCGGPEEIITDGETGFLFDINDINQLTNITVMLINDSNYRKNISINAFENMKERFSNYAYVTNILKSYNSVDNV